MLKSKEPDQQKYALSDNVMSQLTVIVICCDLLKEEPAEPAENSRRLYMIRNAAQSIAQELSRNECDPEEALPLISTVKPQLLC